ncbi:hypothetical protein L9F63_017168, partial [Diploptera punctata]
LLIFFKSRLVSHAYKLYFQEQTYYRVSNLDGRIENADHRLTDDITAFTSSIAHLYSHITKPLFDCLLIAIALARTNKKMGAAIIPVYLIGILLQRGTRVSEHGCMKVAPKRDLTHKNLKVEFSVN